MHPCAFEKRYLSERTFCLPKTAKIMPKSEVVQPRTVPSVATDNIERSFVDGGLWI
jgi:hypothetical protein